MMSKKNTDHKNRWRNKTIAFRMSAPEWDMLNRMVKISGLNKQDYLISRVLDTEVVVRGNSRVFVGLKEELQAIYNQLARLNEGDTLPEETTQLLTIILTIIQRMEDNAYV